MATKTSATGPRRTPVVILFAETRGFTRMSEILQPSVVLAQIAVFYALVRTAVEDGGGTILNALNDTLMASFAGDGQARRSVEAAQRIQLGFAELEEAWSRDYGIRAAVAMGLHAGEVTVGATDAVTPVQPLVIGDSVSIAERLLHRARAGEFVLSEPLMDALAADDFALEAEALPALEIPRREPIGLYGVLRDARLDFT